MKAKVYRKTRHFMKADELCQQLIDGIDGEPSLHWKFAVKAAYLKAVMLASCMEYAKPKALLDFAEKKLSTLL